MPQSAKLRAQFEANKDVVRAPQNPLSRCMGMDALVGVLPQHSCAQHRIYDVHSIRGLTTPTRMP